MKKTLIAFAALTAIAGAAQAQSTVTLYGVADAYVGQKTTKVGNGSKVKNTVVDSAGLNGSRFGFRGTEDLGSGLKAVFTLEGGLNIDNGSSAQGGALFGRQAFVGLSGNFGTATLGRQYTAYDNLRGATNNTYDAAWFATTSRVWAAGNVAGYTDRVNNSFAYASPVFSGFSGAFVLSGAENKTSTLKAGFNNSLHIKYANGPVLVGYALQVEKVQAGAELTNNLFAGSYDLGVAKLTAGYNAAKSESKVANVTTTAKDKEYQFGVSAPFGAATVAAGYTRSKGDNTAAKGTGYSLLGTYDLSKRTRLYAGYTNEKLTAAAVGNAAPVATKTTLIAAGVRHAF